jgi:hypothetical protein
MLRQPAAQPLPALGGILSQSERRRRLPLPGCGRADPRAQVEITGRPEADEFHPVEAFGQRRRFDFGPHLPPEVRPINADMAASH